jgi:hypothetical protein
MANVPSSLNPGSAVRLRALQDRAAGACGIDTGAPDVSTISIRKGAANAREANKFSGGVQMPYLALFLLILLAGLLATCFF